MFDLSNPKTYHSVVNGHVVSNNTAGIGRSYSVYSTDKCVAICTRLETAMDVAKGSLDGGYKLPAVEVPDEPTVEPGPVAEPSAEDVDDAEYVSDDEVESPQIFVVEEDDGEEEVDEYEDDPYGE